MFSAFQRQLDTRSLEMAAAAQEHISQHERTCTDRWEDSRAAQEELKETLKSRVLQTQKLHEENQKELTSIKRLIYIGLGIAMTIGALNTELGRRVAGLLNTDNGQHNSVTIQSNPTSKER